MQVFAGTSGFSYPEWKGFFYPERTDAKSMLGFYGQRLPTVEINNTFYRMPKKGLLAGWAEQVPASFRFVVKASRRITHFKRLAGASGEAGYVFDTARELGSRLGAILFQLPPNLPADVSRLQDFVAHIPPDIRAVFEFRHPSWATDEVSTVLQASDHARCISDGGRGEPAPLAEHRWGYARLRKEHYDDDDLLSWLQRFRTAGFEHVYVMFKHEDEGAAPRFAQRLLELAAARQG